MDLKRIPVRPTVILYAVLSLCLTAASFIARPEDFLHSLLLFALCAVGVFVFVQLEQFERDLKQAKGLQEAQLAITNSAYNERNYLVALLARLYPSGIRPTQIEGWDPDWQNCVYIELPSGQISYHYHTSEARLFDGLPAYTGDWDGHQKQDVHNRLLASKTLTGLVPTAWLDCWVATNLRDAENCGRLKASDQADTYLQHQTEFFRWLNKDLTEYLGMRVFLKRHTEDNWNLKTIEAQRELRELGKPLDF